MDPEPAAEALLRAGLREVGVRALEVRPLLPDVVRVAAEPAGGGHGLLEPAAERLRGRGVRERPERLAGIPRLGEEPAQPRVEAQAAGQLVAGVPDPLERGVPAGVEQRPGAGAAEPDEHRVVEHERARRLGGEPPRAIRPEAGEAQEAHGRAAGGEPLGPVGQRPLVQVPGADRVAAVVEPHDAL